MKNIMVILFCFFVIQNSKAQDPNPDLVETLWYLSTINTGGINISPPSNEELAFIPLLFLPNSNEFLMDTCVCYCGQTGVVQFNSNSIQFDGMSFLITEGCDMFENSIFQDIYFVEFFQTETNAVSDPIEYEILTDSDGNKQLTLTNSNGDVAVYGDQLLGVEDNRLPTFTIASNPVQNTLSLVLPESLKNSSIEVYDIRGKLQISKTSTNTTVATDVSNLTNGVYLVVVTNSVTKSIKKFIKE